MKVLQLILNLWGCGPQDISQPLMNSVTFTSPKWLKWLVPSHQKKSEASNGRSFPAIEKKKNSWNVPEFQLRGSSGLRPRPRTLEPAQLTGSKNDGMRQQDTSGDSTFEEVLQILWFKTTIYPSTSKMFILRKYPKPQCSKSCATRHIFF